MAPLFSRNMREAAVLSCSSPTIPACSVDLGVCGHYHGGQVWIPFVGGLYHGDTGMFPKYSGGLYSLTHSTIFVSRGMGGHSGLPRINNRPELAVIDINGRQDPGRP